MKYIYLVPFFVLFYSCGHPGEKSLQIASGGTAPEFYIDDSCDQLIEWAVNDLADDVENITGNKPLITKTDQLKAGSSGTGIYIGRSEDNLMKSIPGIDTDELSGKWEAFSMEISENYLFITGSDIRGTVYGIFDLAERLGISPWKWWADVVPEKRDELILSLPENKIVESPSVQYRGIFLNDEDFGLQPWAAKTFEPETGDIGPKTYEKIFQLLLRLKANTIWPAMHNCTKAFYTIPGNKEMARKYHIVIGTSHAEPMLRNNVSEWDHQEMGDFNYFTNQARVDEYWRERIDDLDPWKDHFIVTVGMRGVHDSGMEGGGSTEDQVAMLEKIINNQRTMLENSFDRPANAIPQVFVPYKEVLSLYNAGLELPEDITLMWTDDNYGYIRRLSDDKEQERKGGSGVYYHVSYWGRPHDYLWLSSTQPGQIWYEMSRAYQNGARKVWILNVGDIKPAEYDMEFFLDLAWNIDMVNVDNIDRHLETWADREFGSGKAGEVANVMEEYYRLAFLRRPEFMGWSRTEPTTGTKPTAFNPDANGNEAQKRIDAYKALYDRVDRIKSQVSADRKDAYFQLIEYPVKCAALMNIKFLDAQLAYHAENQNRKQGYSNTAWEAYEEINYLTRNYNDVVAGGKWKYMMDMQPRGLPAFEMPEYHLKSGGTGEKSDARKSGDQPVFIQAADYSGSEGAGEYAWKAIRGLGYSNEAITLMPLRSDYFTEDKPSVTYRFKLGQPGRYEVEVRCLPTHSNDFNATLTVRVDDNEPEDFPINTMGRSEAWKQNVLRNYTPLKYSFEAGSAGNHVLTLQVNQTGIVIDQIAVNPPGCERYYEIPLGQ